MKYRLYTFKKEKKQQWLDWCDFLNAHKDEVEETLKQEKCKREVFYMDFNDDEYVFYGMDSLFLKSEDNQLNRDHRKNVKECLCYVADFNSSLPEHLTSLFDFQV